MFIRGTFVFMLIALVACGGGGGGGLADTGVGGSGGVSTSDGVVGPFQGHGSIIINDRTLTTDGAAFELEGVMGVETDLQEGQRLVVIADLGTSVAEQVFYRSDAKGPISGFAVLDPLAGAAEFSVLGRTIRTNSATRYGNGSFSLLADGDLVEISGAVNAAGELHATFIETKPSLAEYKVVGTVANLTATTFDLNALTVDFNTATLSEFEGAALAEGQVVEVKMAPGDFMPPADAVATEVELLTVPTFDENAEVEFEGFVDRFISATNFDVAGLAVTTTGATVFVNGSAASLAVNVKIEAEGTIDAAGVLVADRIIIKPTDSVRVEGTVAQVDLMANTVSTDVGLTFAVRALTELEDDSSAGLDPFTLDLLVPGDFVEIRAFLDGTTLVAAELEREDFDDRTRMRGPITNEDQAAGTVDILGVTVTGVDGVTEYRDVDDTTIDQADFHALVDLGAFVEARWDLFTSTTVTADQLSIEEDDD